MAVKTAAELRADVDSLFADNITGNISAADARTITQDIYDSMGSNPSPDLIQALIDALTTAISPSQWRGLLNDLLDHTAGFYSPLLDDSAEEAILAAQLPNNTSNQITALNSRTALKAVIDFWENLEGVDYYDFSDLDDNNSNSLTATGPYGLTDEGLALADPDGSLEADAPTWAATATEYAMAVGVTHQYTDNVSTTYAPVAGIRDDSSPADEILAVSFRTRNTSAPTNRFLAFSYYDGTANQNKFIGYMPWRWRAKPSAISGKIMQAIYVDNTHIYVAGYTGSPATTTIYKLNRSDYSLVDSCTHVGKIGGMDYDSVHGWWMMDNSDDELLGVDIDESFSTGTLDVTATVTMDVGAVNGFSSVSFYDDDGTTRVLISVYAEAVDRDQYVCTTSLLSDGVSFDGTNHLVTKFQPTSGHYKVQSVARYTDGKVLVIHSGSGNPNRAVKLMDMDDFINNATSGDEYTNYILDVEDPPTAWGQDVSYDPSGELWMSPEGVNTFGDVAYIYSLPGDWKDPPRQDIYAHHDGSTITLEVNGQEFNTYSVTGGLPTFDTIFFDSASEFTCQYFATNDSAIPSNTRDSLAALSPGLTTAASGLTNPGAESGDTTGWTNETGTLGVKTGAHQPQAGAYYFYGGANALMVAYQRIDIGSVTGLSDAEIDSLAPTLYVKYFHSSFAELDKARVYIRWRNSGLTLLSTVQASLDAMERDHQWHHRIITDRAPTNARYADVVIENDRDSGTNSDGYIDSIDANFYW